MQRNSQSGCAAKARQPDANFDESVQATGYVVEHGVAYSPMRKVQHLRRASLMQFRSEELQVAIKLYAQW